jgi:hypothetical protein
MDFNKLLAETLNDPDYANKQTPLQKLKASLTQEEVEVKRQKKANFLAELFKGFSDEEILELTKYMTWKKDRHVVFKIPGFRKMCAYTEYGSLRCGSFWYETSCFRRLMKLTMK